MLDANAGVIKFPLVTTPALGLPPRRAEPGRYLQRVMLLSDPYEIPSGNVDGVSSAYVVARVGRQKNSSDNEKEQLYTEILSGDTELLEIK